MHGQTDNKGSGHGKIKAHLLGGGILLLGGGGIENVIVQVVILKIFL